MEVVCTVLVVVASWTFLPVAVYRWLFG